jgi:hypothetical protein
MQEMSKTPMRIQNFVKKSRNWFLYRKLHRKKSCENQRLQFD